MSWYNLDRRRIEIRGPILKWAALFQALGGPVCSSRTTGRLEAGCEGINRSKPGRQSVGDGRQDEGLIREGAARIFEGSLAVYERVPVGQACIGLLELVVDVSRQEVLCYTEKNHSLHPVAYWFLSFFLFMNHNKIK